MKDNVPSLASFLDGLLIPDIGLDTVNPEGPVKGIFPPRKTGYPMALGIQSFYQGHANETASSCNKYIHINSLRYTNISSFF
jgi:hypothetical protein